MGANQDTFSYNLFAYCSNNPVNYSDPTGEWKLWDKFVSKVTDFLQSFISEYNTQKTVIVTSAAASITGKNIDLGKGWTARIDSAKEGTKAQTHVHVDKGKYAYAQNEDGSKHDGSSTKGGPPNSVKKKLKEKTGWDWDANADKFALEHGYDFTDVPMNQIFFMPVDPSGFMLPSFESSFYTTPVFAP